MDAREKLRGLIHNPPLADKACQQRHATVYEYVLNNSEHVSQSNFSKISSADLGLMFQAIDEQYFAGQVGSVCEQVAARPLSFRLSTRMTTSGGMTTMLRPRNRRSKVREFEIAVATTPLFESFRDSQPLQVGGLPCANRLQALQRIMEHEMVHLIEMLLWDDSNCSAKPFKRIVNSFFGHTESNHRLLTPRDIANQILGLSAGDRVSFVQQGRRYQGTLNRVTKRATVLVADAKGDAYDDGCRYKKYYVPLNRLTRE